MIFVSFTQNLITMYFVFTKLEAFQKWLNVDMFVLLYWSIHWQQHQCKWFTSCWFDFFISFLINYWVTEPNCPHQSHSFIMVCCAYFVLRLRVAERQKGVYEGVYVLWKETAGCEGTNTTQNGQVCKIKQPIFKKTLPTSLIQHKIQWNFV